MTMWAAAGITIGLLAAAGAIGLLAPISAAGQPPRPLLISRQLAAHARLAIGDEVTVSSGTSGALAQAFRIAGIYEPIADPMQLTSLRLEARMHLPDLLSLTEATGRAGGAGGSATLANPDSVTAINVLLEEPDGAEARATEISNQLPGILAMPARSESADSPFLVLERFHLAIALVTVLGSSAFLLALMVMQVEERKEAIGILRLIGLRRSRIVSEVLLEGLAIAVCGALFGVILAALGQGAVNRLFQWHYDTPLVFVRITWPVALRCIVIAVPLGILAGLGASWSLLRREITALVRR